MDLILKNRVDYHSKIIDFGVDPVNKSVITTGDKLIFRKDGIIEKEISGKAKNSEVIKYIKKENQLFVSNNFFISTMTGKVLKCDSLKKKIDETVFDINKIVEYLNVTTSGKIIYVEDNMLFSYDTVTKKLISSDYLIKSNTKGNYKIFISGENIILKYREIHTQANIISIFDATLTKIFEVKTESNHIYSKIVGLEYIGGTSSGEIEIWNILEQEMYNSIKLSDVKINFIEKVEDNYLIAFGNGDIFVVNEDFEIISKHNISKTEIVKMCVIEDMLYVLVADNKILEFEIINELNENKSLKFRESFLEKYKIHKDYLDFFNIHRICKIENFIKQMELQNIDFTPKKELIFRALSDSIESRKVCLIGKDPYFQEGVATGLSFEVKKETWSNPEVNTSLKNILKLIYKTYTGRLEDIVEIRQNIESGKFKILSPIELFKSWKEQGVLLLNSALTTIVGKAGEHHKFWDSFTKELLEYISEKNNRIVYFLWGKDAEVFEKNILSGDIIKHNHPAICGNLENKKDFLNGESFKNTRNIINWTGFDNNEYGKIGESTKLEVEAEIKKENETKKENTEVKVNITQGKLF